MMSKKDYEIRMDLTQFLDTIKSFINMPYRWAGDDAVGGFDCSGSVVEALKSIGYIKEKEDFTADGLWKKYSEDYEEQSPSIGSIVFWFDSNGKAIHVAVALNQFFCITADGGGSHVKTEEDAIKYNAFMKYRRIDKRGDGYKSVNLFNV